MKRPLYLMFAFLWIILSPLNAEHLQSPTRFSMALNVGPEWLWNLHWHKDLADADLKLARENIGPDLIISSLNDSISSIVPRFDLELMYRITQSLHIGISMGYLSSTWETGGFYTDRGLPIPQSEMRIDHTCRLRLFPLQALLNYRIAQGSSGTLHLTAAISWNIAETKWASKQDRLFLSSFTGKQVRNILYTDINRAYGANFGTRLGLSYEYSLLKHLALTASCFTRFGPNLITRGMKQQHEQLFVDGELISDFFYPEDEDAQSPPVSSLDMNSLGIAIGIKLRL